MLGHRGTLPGLYKAIFSGLILVCFGINYHPVAAATTVEDQITVTATVAPARYIIVNTNGLIKEIDSNTTEPVIPKVYIGSIRSTAIPLSPLVLNEYTKIISKCNFRKIGIIYSANVSHPVKNPVVASRLVAINNCGLESGFRCSYHHHFNPYP